MHKTGGIGKDYCKISGQWVRTPQAGILPLGSSKAGLEKETMRELKLLWRSVEWELCPFRCALQKEFLRYEDLKAQVTFSPQGKKKQKPEDEFACDFVSSSWTFYCWLISVSSCRHIHYIRSVLPFTTIKMQKSRSWFTSWALTIFDTGRKAWLDFLLFVRLL